MTKTTYFTLWGGLFIICAGLGFIPEPQGFARVLLTVFSLAFFLPPAMLLYFAGQKRDRLTIRLIRDLSLASLGLTVVLILANFFSLMAPEALGNILYVLLVIVSSPMVCCGYWAVSLFFWACLLMGSLSMLKKRK